MHTYFRILINWATDLIVSFSCEFISFTDVTSTLNTVWIILPRNQTLQKDSHEYINPLNNYLQSLQLGPFLESPGYKSTGNQRSGGPSSLFVLEGRGKNAWYINYFPCHLPVVQNLDFCLTGRTTKEPTKLNTDWLQAKYLTSGAIR